ncbi:MAG: phosphoethanolamine transferase, partial [Muribaculaceae bacterium]|nr:phosphoethanolamine transferase [Muribaculaceae bacterium]
FSTALIILYLAGVAALKATLLLLPLSWMMERRAWRWAAWTGLAIYALLALFNFASWAWYGFGINRRMMIIAMQTTPAETLGFMTGVWSNITSLVASPSAWLCVAAVAAAYVLVRRMGRRSFTIMVSSLSALGICCLVWFCSREPNGKSAHIMAARIPKYAYEVYRSERDFQRMISQKRPLPDRETASSSHRASTVLLVLGESASSSHWSLYGYPMPTTPRIDARADSLTVFSDAIASSVSTASNMERILTFKYDDTTYNDWYRFPGLVDLFKEVGYKFYWFSNQDRMGMLGNSSGIIASNADVIEYVGAELSGDISDESYDSELCRPVDMAMADSSACHKFIVTHMMGSHTAYVHRYPASQAFFTGADEIHSRPRPWLNQRKADIAAHYDNSILFTDSILALWIDSLAARPEPAVMVYISDHGENVYDNRDFVGRDVQCVRIPMFIYANAPYRAACPDVMELMEAAKDRPMSTANLIHAILTLTGTAYSAYDPSRDVLSPQYKIRPRLVDEEVWPYETAEATP